MTKLGRPTGLVRYDSLRGFEAGARRFWRGRVAMYAVLLAMGVGAFAFAVTRRHPFEAMLVRAPGRAYTVEADRVHNVFDLHLINKRPGPRTFALEVLGPEGAETMLALREVPLDSLQEMKVPVHVFLPLAAFRAGLKVELRARCDEDGGELERLATAPLLGPSARHR
jgi:polyferredoxin